MKFETYETMFIPEELDLVVEKGLEKGNRLRKKRRRNRIVAVLSSMAAVFAVFITLCAKNATFASYIPFVDKIFEKVEENAVFQGDYSEHSTHLAEIAGVEKSDAEMVLSDEHTNPLEQLEELYGDTDQNITVTPEEVFCDGASLYLGLRLTMLDGSGWGMESADERDRAYGAQLIGVCEVGGLEIPFSNWVSVSDTESSNVMIGMIKLPANGIADTVADVKVKISTLCWNDYNVRKAAVGTSAEEKREWYHVLAGEWTLEVPVTIDTSRIREISINESNALGYGLETVKITPYEIQVKAIKPAKDAAELRGAFAIFNENGEAFAYGEGSDRFDCYIVNGKSTEKLSLYYFYDEIEAFKCKNQEEAEANSIYKYELN